MPGSGGLLEKARFPDHRKDSNSPLITNYLSNPHPPQVARRGLLTSMDHRKSLEW